MKLCVIHGSARRGGNTDKTIEFIKEQMNRLETIEYIDIYLPKDLPHFCTGCMACLGTGSYAGENCPHKSYTHPILKALLEADGIIIGCPGYALAETAQVKNLLDHLACTYIVHRPNVEMYDKTALVISTVAGAGSGRANSTIGRNLLFWGVKRIQKCRFRLWDGNWKSMSRERQEKYEKQIKKEAIKFYKMTKKRYKICPNLASKMIRMMIKISMKSRDDTNTDKIYWKAKGWIK